MRNAFVNESPGIAKWRTSSTARAAYTYVPAASNIPGIGATSGNPDPTVHVKLFNPSTGWTWFLTEADVDTGEAYGLVKGFELELGYIDLNEIAALRTKPFGLPIERDIHFRPRPLSVVRAALEAGKHV